MLLVGSIAKAVATAIGRVEEITICSGAVLDENWFHDQDPNISMQGGVRPNTKADNFSADDVNPNIPVHVQTLSDKTSQSEVLKTNGSVLVDEDGTIANQKVTILSTAEGMVYVSNKAHRQRSIGNSILGASSSKKYDYRLYSPTTTYGTTSEINNFFTEFDKLADEIVYRVDWDQLKKVDNSPLFTATTSFLPNESFFFADGMKVCLVHRPTTTNTPVTGRGLRLTIIEFTEAYNILKFVESSVKLVLVPWQLTYVTNSTSNRLISGVVQYDDKNKELLFSADLAATVAQRTPNTTIFDIDLNTVDFDTYDWTVYKSQITHNGDVNLVNRLRYCPSLLRSFSRNGKYVYNAGSPLGGASANRAVSELFGAYRRRLLTPYDYRTREVQSDIDLALSDPYPEYSVRVSTGLVNTRGFAHFTQNEGLSVSTPAGSDIDVVRGITYRIRNVFDEVPNQMIKFSSELRAGDRTCYAEQSTTENDTVDIVMRGGTLSKIALSAGTMTHFIVKFYGTSGTTYGIGTIGLVGSGADMEFVTTSVVPNDVVEVTEVKFKVPLSHLYKANRLPLLSEVP